MFGIYGLWCKVESLDFEFRVRVGVEGVAVSDIRAAFSKNTRPKSVVRHVSARSTGQSGLLYSGTSPIRKQTPPPSGIPLGP